MPTFTIRSMVRVGEIPHDRMVDAPADLMTLQQAASLGHRLIEAAEAVTKELRAPKETL